MSDLAFQRDLTQRAALLASVEGMRDLLAAGEQAEEAAGNVSAQTIAALAESGILAMKLPRELGGGEADPLTQIEVFEAIAAINASASWCAMIGATGVGMPGAFLSEEAISQMFADKAIPRACIVASPSGKAIVEPTGVRLSGRWRFASGVRHAEWITAGAWIQGEGTARVRGMMSFPATAASIHDNWQVMGLEATGSCDFSVDELFVPDAFFWRLAEAEPRRGGALYKLGVPGFVANEHIGFALGVGRRALNELITAAGSSRRGVVKSASTLADRSAVQNFIGTSEIRLKAARSLGMAVYADVYSLVQSGERPSARLQAEIRSATAYCTEVAMEIVTGAFRLTGGGAVYRAGTLQRCLRDLNVASQHFVVSDVTYENLGKLMLGFEDVDPMG